MPRPGLSGRVALVTGAAQGIGAAVARRLGADGAVVALADAQEDAVHARRDALAAEGIEALAVVCDVRDPASVDAAVAKVLEDVPEISILVNNAGIRRDRTLKNMGDDEWSDVVDVNLRGAFNCCRAVVPHMPDDRGRIVSMSSRLFLGNFGSTNYAASKAGLIGLSRSLALEVAARGITVNVVAPGVIQSPGMEQFKADAPEVFENFMKGVPMRRAGSADDIAGLISFLASDDAGYITGQTIFVCGGWSIGASLY